jgi:hypothetical protein
VTRLDVDIQETFDEWIKSAEFRAIGDLIGRIAFFRNDEHRITWAVISFLFDMPKSAFHWLLHHFGDEMADDKTTDHIDAALCGPNRYLTRLEEDVVLQWIWDTQCERKCSTSTEVREFATNLRRQRTVGPVTGLAGIVVRPGIRT